MGLVLFECSGELFRSGSLQELDKFFAIKAIYEDIARDSYWIKADAFAMPTLKEMQRVPIVRVTVNEDCGKVKSVEFVDIESTKDADAADFRLLVQHQYANGEN